ncbi:hypothetical protein [Rhodococcus sp. IEGM 1408]|uniref:hypothetical protein n=1 Tax=Rhodococcus sp. IEGM 1408 TaxID=3082220 RepID=UPI002953C841|nr:hypothetical protein [Rhodococcus sp. IEGM 1408]MDV7999895.1 hypothetical protein [Rhodococcus sp. IEGM 1408]
MFSTVDPGTYTGTASDGSERDLGLDELPLVTRAVAYSDDVLQLLCDQHADLASVARSGAEEGLLGHEKVYQC